MVLPVLGFLLGRPGLAIAADRNDHRVLEREPPGRSLLRASPRLTMVMLSVPVRDPGPRGPPLSGSRASVEPERLSQRVSSARR